MAISKGHLKFTGRVGELLYYYVGNQIYVRTVFAGQRKRVMKDKRYELFRLYGTFFSQSSKIGSFVYKALGLKNEQKVYNKLVGEAQKFFKHTGMSGQQILEVMVEKYLNGFGVEVPGENEVGGVKDEIETQEMIGMLEKTEDRMEYENMPKYTEEEVVISEQVTRKRLRILKAAVKIRWKGNDVLSKRMNNDYGEEGKNWLAPVDSNNSVATEEKTLNSV